MKSANLGQRWGLCEEHAEWAMILGKWWVMMRMRRTMKLPAMPTNHGDAATQASGNDTTRPTGKPNLGESLCIEGKSPTTLTTCTQPFPRYFAGISSCLRGCVSCCESCFLSWEFRLEMDSRQASLVRTCWKHKSKWTNIITSYISGLCKWVCSWIANDLTLNMIEKKGIPTSNLSPTLQHLSPLIWLYNTCSLQIYDEWHPTMTYWDV